MKQNYIKMLAWLFILAIIMTGCSSENLPSVEKTTTLTIGSTVTQTAVPTMSASTTGKETTTSEAVTTVDTSAIIKNDETGIPDPVLYKAIAKELGKDVSIGFTINEAATLTFFSYCFFKEKIKSIKGIGKIKNLNSLSLNENEIVDFSPVISLKKLKNLNLTNNKIKDITVAAKLKNLDTLNFSYNQIENVAPLAALTNLKELFLWYNNIKDIKPLLNLRRLTALNLESNYLNMNDSKTVSYVNTFRSRFRNFALGVQGVKVSTTYTAPVMLYIDKQQQKDMSGNIFYTKAMLDGKVIERNKLYILTEPKSYVLQMWDNLETHYVCVFVIKK